MGRTINVEIYDVNQKTTHTPISVAIRVAVKRELLR